MSQEVGYQYKSRIPTLSDDATIVEALKVYHYGVDNWSTEPIPDDSIEGNFRSLNDDVTTLQSQVSGLGTTYVQQISLTATPNIITGEGLSTVPLTVKAIASQTAALQQWQNSSSVNVGSISTGGFTNMAGYLTVGSTTQSTTTGVNVVLGNAAHKGIVVKAQSAQTENLQEWQNNAGTAISWVDKDGKVYSNSIQTVNLTDTQTLTNKSLTSPTVTTPITITGIKVPTLSAGEYTVGLSDRDYILEFPATSSLLIPYNSTTAFPIGSTISLLQTGTGQVTVAATVGVGTITINATPGKKTRTQWSLITLVKRNTDTWVVFGDSAA